MTMSHKEKEKRICKNCGHTFLFYIYSKNKGIYCSRKCVIAKMSETMKKIWVEGLVIRRTWKKVNQKNFPFILTDDCSMCGKEYYPGYQRDMTCGIYCEDCHQKNRLKKPANALK